MRLALALVLGLSAAHAQMCVPVRILPVGSVSGTLDNSSCLLPDGTSYASYRLDLPTRGQFQINLTAANASLILRDGTGAGIASGTSIQRAVEAGSYTLLVNAPTPGGGPAAYSVQTAFTAETGMMCTSFPNAGLNQATAGTLGASGCIAPDGTPYEGYFVTTLGSGTLTVSVSSPDFTPALTVRDDDGYPLGSDAAQVSVAVDGDNQYEIVVAGTAAQTGSYQLTTSFVPDDSETCRPMKTFTDSGSDSASITADSCTTTIPQSSDLTYYNYYNFTVPAAGLADVTASSTDFGATLSLLDDGGNVLAIDTLGSGPNQSEIRMQLSPGNYTAQVISSISAGGAYQFSYQFTAGPPQPCVPVAANPGDALAGSLGASSCRTSLGLADLYSFTLAAAGTLNISLNAIGFSSLLAIRDAKDNLVVSYQDVEGLGVSALTADLPAGTYTIVAAAASGSGGYQVTPQFTAHAITPCSYVQALDINGGYIQKLGPGSCRGGNGQPVDLYQFTLPSDGVVAAFMTSSEVDGFLTLVDSAGNFLRSDDNSYAVNDPLIVQFLSAGTYQLAARAAGSTVGGYYEVDLRTVPGPRPPFCASRGQLAVGGSINGTLTVAACQYIDGTFAGLYQMVLASDTTIDLRLDSSDFDAYLVLLDAKGNVVDQDDDSGGGTNARLNELLAAGTYYVVAKPFSGYTSVGGYTLSLAGQ
ncbi:Peptidase domain protein [Candidatus Sulfopaludibacter sp. SbA4]|nr:Peptidase domain protein [Candidatus Sulfopaludibacter sp. SbA4]